MRDYLKTFLAGSFLAIAISFLFMPLPPDGISENVGGGSGTITKLPGTGSGSGHTIEDEGTPLTARTSLNFVGTGVTATDSGGKTVVTISSGGDALTANPLSQFAATTSLQLKGVISDETGSGALVFGTDPTFTTRINTPEIQATSSAGVDINNNVGTQVALFGAGGGTGTSLVGTTNIGSASADYLQIAGGTGALTLTGTGSSTNINITLTPKGSGVVNTNTLTLTGTGTLNGLDVIDATGEATLESTLDIAGDISSTGLSNTVIGNDKILEVMLKSVNSPTDEQCLSYEATGGDFEWQTCGSGGSGITVGTTTITSGTSGRIPFNNAGVYGEDSAINWDSTSKSLKIGTGTPTYTVGTNNPLTMTGNMNTYYATQLQNLSAGTTASTDLVLNADNATDTTNYLDIGIASSGNTDALYTFAGAGEAYMYTASSNLAIATAASAKSIKFFTGGTLAANIRLTIDGTGLMTHTGVGTTQTQYTQTYDTITTGKGQLMTLNGLTSGTGLEITSTSTGAPTTATYSGSNKGYACNFTGTNSTTNGFSTCAYFLNAKLGTTSKNYGLIADTTNASGVITNIPIMWIGHLGGGAKLGNISSTEAGIWFNSVTPSTTNYTISFDSTTAYFNSSFKIRSGASNQAGMNSTGVWFDSGSGNVATGGQRLISRNAATASANYGSISLGAQGNWAGGGTTPFAGSASGTHFAINEASGYAGDFVNWQLAGTSKFKVASSGLINMETTITAGGTTGNQTINKPTGTVNIAASGTAVTITNSVVTASSIVMAVARTNDTTCSVKNAVPGSGTVTINMTAACTAETSVGFVVINN